MIYLGHVSRSQVKGQGHHVKNVTFMDSVWLIVTKFGLVIDIDDMSRNTLRTHEFLTKYKIYDTGSWAHINVKLLH